MRKARLQNLAESDQGEIKVQCDVCVVGAGAAGTYLASRLVANGKSVILVEAGDKHCRDASAIGFDSQFESAIYAGATVGRYFGLGGSTSQWGGLLVPHTQHDIRPSGGEEAGPWSHIVEAVKAKTQAVLGQLGWHGEPEFTKYARQLLGDVGESLGAAGFEVASGLFLPVRQKNMAYLLTSLSAGSHRLQVIHNAVAKSWLLAPTSAAETVIQKLVAVSGNEKRMEISATHFVIAAGAIESARMLLEFNETGTTPKDPAGSAVGCFLSDHLSVAIAAVDPPDYGHAIKTFGPRFSGQWMRSFRFVESDPPPETPRAFLHFIFDNQSAGFALAKEVLSAMQGRRWPKISPAETLTGGVGLLALAFKRYCESRLYVPSNTAAHLQLDIEQLPLRENRVSLGTERDRYGRRVARINWNIAERDVENIYRTARRILNKWPGERGGLPKLLPIDDACDATKPHDAYHPVGTCRMGGKGESVVDQNLKVWGISNLWMVTTGVLPSAGTANPTFTMLCLAEGLVEHLASSIGA